MEEIAHARTALSDLRWQLMSTGSALSVLLSIYCVSDAHAADASEHPTLWIELGGQLGRNAGQVEPFAPPFASHLANDGFTSPVAIQRPPLYSFGGIGQLLFEPNGSDWVFSAGVMFGRANGNKHVHQQTAQAPQRLHVYGTVYRSHNPTFAEYSDSRVKHNESHTILDFRVGKDVGLGMFGATGSSVINLGVRFAQFGATSDLGLAGDPLYVVHLSQRLGRPKYHHDYQATAESSRNFHGVGPSISWNASAPFAGNRDSIEFSVDWGANAAVLFGKQRASVQHQTYGGFHCIKLPGIGEYPGIPAGDGYNYFSHYSAAAAHVRERFVAVKNLGGFAGVSLKFPNAKISLGYRADFFFGAIDGGIDTRKSEDAGFYGPFATISIGLGG